MIVQTKSRDFSYFITRRKLRNIRREACTGSYPARCCKIMLYILAIIFAMVWNLAMCVGLLIYNYASDFRNMLDWMRAMVEVGGLWALYTWVEEEVHRAWQYELVAAWCLVKWFQAMYALRGFDLFGPRILPILRAVKDTAAFLVVMLFNLFGFTHAYYVLGRRDGPNLFYASLLSTFRLGVMGDFDMFELEGEPQDPDPSSNPLYNHVHTWFLLTSIVSAVMMMNLLVGILGSNYERFEEQSQALFVRERARIITLQSLRPYPWVRWVWRRLEMEDRHLFVFVTKETPDTEEERSTRKAMQLLIMEPLKKQIESLDRKVGNAVSALKLLMDAAGVNYADATTQLDAALDAKTSGGESEAEIQRNQVREKDNAPQEEQRADPVENIETRQRAQQLSGENEKLLPIEQIEQEQQTHAHAAHLIELLRTQNERLEAKLDQNQLTSTSQIEHLRKQNESLEATQAHAASQIEQLRKQNEKLEKQNEKLEKQNESLEAKVDQMIQMLKSLKFE